MKRKFKVSERRACRVVGQHRSTNRYVPTPADFEANLVARMIALAEVHPRWGYRTIHSIPLEEGWPVNKKRVERLWRVHGLQVPPRKAKNGGQKALGDDDNSIWRLPPLYPNHIWSYDFIKRRTSDGRPLRVLNVIDEFTRVSLGSLCARSIGSRKVESHLEKLFARHGKPTLIRADNGREFIADRLQDALAAQGVRAVFIAKASPQQNGFIERFNGSMENEVFGMELLHSVLEAQVVVDEWNGKYNHRRPHQAHGGMTPAAFAKIAKVQHAMNATISGGGS